MCTPVLIISHLELGQQAEDGARVGHQRAQYCRCARRPPLRPAGQGVLSAGLVQVVCIYVAKPMCLLHCLAGHGLLSAGDDADLTYYLRGLLVCLPLQPASRNLSMGACAGFNAMLDV